MNWLDKLEKKWGRYAIPNMNRYLVFAILFGYLIMNLNKNIASFLLFDAASIFKGQIWRLFTWILIPPGGGAINGLGFVFNLLFLYCIVSMGRSLEMMFGTFKMNAYYIGGILLSDIAGILIFIITKAVTGVGFPVYLTTYYILLSTFMLLGLCMPNAMVNLYFVLPIKMKWMLLLFFGDLAYELFSYFRQSAIIGIVYGSQIVFALLNLGFFFYMSKSHVSLKQKKRQREFKAQFSQPREGSGIYKHKCAICGKTELDDPNLVFRYCSKCEGNYEYCQNHLFTHEHVKR